MTLLVLLPLRGVAQDSSSGGSDISVYVGQILPNQIQGVDEILPVFGARYAFGLGPGSLESGLSNSSAEGIDYTTFFSSYRGLVEWDQDLYALFYGGLDLHWYKRKNASDRVLDYGFHVGTGAVLALTSSVSLRGELKFNASPGTALSFLFGFMFGF